ncbi:hypothetical protein ACFVX6_36260 [Streptomyces sp. NPDC058289]|uniref:hypothetical protein n=1 Tax=Streptomyces sp. NPDC058289 TaxID=3346425 RepID=UPI0036DFE9C2
MSVDVRYRVERIALALMSISGVVVLIADLLGWLDALAPGGALPKVTLLILSTVTVFLLLEIDRLRKLDVVEAKVIQLDATLTAQVARLDDTLRTQLAQLDIDTVAQQLKQENYLGVIRVHAEFPDVRFNAFVEGATQEVAILQTFIPNLEHLQPSLEKALVDHGVPVRIMLLYPSSPVAGLRDEALRSVRDPALALDVKARVEMCLAGLAELHRAVGPTGRALLQVRVYNSLPSIAVHKADEHFLVSSFLHRQLAINSAQTEIDGCDTAMGRQVQRELDTLWEIGRDVALPDWRESLRNISW